MNDAAVLRARVHDALTELRAMGCTDPAADDAVAVIRLTERTLADWWAPTLDRLMRNAAPGD